MRMMSDVFRAIDAGRLPLSAASSFARRSVRLEDDDGGKPPPKKLGKTPPPKKKTKAKKAAKTKRAKALAFVSRASIERRLARLEREAADVDDAPKPDAEFTARMVWETGLPSAADPVALRQVHAIVHRAGHAHEIDGKSLLNGSEFERQVMQLAASAQITIEQARREFMKALRRGSR